VLYAALVPRTEVLRFYSTQRDARLMNPRVVGVATDLNILRGFGFGFLKGPPAEDYSFLLIL